MAPSSTPWARHRIGKDGAAPIAPRLVIALGVSQIVAWGTMHYLIAVFGAPIGRDLGWTASFVHAGFSLALVTMAVTSTLAGRWIDDSGGRLPMAAGCCAGALGCALLAGVHGKVQYVLAWTLLGVGMRLALYDAAFASLAVLGGAASKRAMSQITLFGGLASTVFWPLGRWLGDALGWRGALGVYAALLLVTAGLHLLTQPAGRPCARPVPAPAADGRPVRRAATAVDKALYAVVATATMAMQTGVASHLLDLLQGFGWSAAMAVALSTLFGAGQLAGRLCVVAWGQRMDAVRLNLLPASLLLLSWAIALAAGSALAGAAAFAFLYGTGNGIATVTRGSMPLVLFDAAGYGRTVGALLRPAFLLAAAAPVATATVLARWGQQATLGLALGTSLLLLGASLALWRRSEARKENR